MIAMGTTNNGQLGRPAPRGSSSGSKVRLAVGLLLALTLVSTQRRTHAAAQAPTDRPDGASGDVQALSAHYRFLEQYTEDPSKADLLNRYQVGCLETVKITRDKAQAAPEVTAAVAQTIYTERVLKLAKDGQVAEVIRRYDKASLRTNGEPLPFKTKPLEGLTIVYRVRSGALPQVLSLTGRQLRGQEFTHIAEQTFLPTLAAILPRQLGRVGDTWTISRAAATALFGSPPTSDEFELTGEIRSVTKNASGTSMTAVFAVKGQWGVSGVNALIHFTFEPSPSKPAASPGRLSNADLGGGLSSTKKAQGEAAAQGNFDARGFISKISLAQETVAVLSENDGRFKQSIRRELRLERRLSASVAGATLDVPNPLPAPSVENTWLIYDDPEGRFHLLHPQEMKVVKQYPDGGIDLLDRRPDGQDVITVNLMPKSGDPERDRLATDPIQEKKRLDDEWKRRGEKVLPGTLGWLPESDWSKLKRRVYRIEAALMSQDDPSAPPSGRIYLDQYVVQFNRNESMKLRAMTTRDPHVPFRDIAESIIRSFELGPSDSALPVAPSPSSAAPPRPPG
jgi:hypothetical protein